MLAICAIDQKELMAAQEVCVSDLGLRKGKDGTDLQGVQELDADLCMLTNMSRHSSISMVSRW